MKIGSNAPGSADDPEIAEVPRECENILAKTRKIEVYLLTNTQVRVII
jgi:hypothetical protein